MEPKLSGHGIVEPELFNGGAPRALKHATERLLAKSYGFMYDAVVSGFPPYERLLDVVTHPFDVRAGLDAYLQPAPPERGPCRTFCGT